MSTMKKDPVMRIIVTVVDVTDADMPILLTMRASRGFTTEELRKAVNPVAIVRSRLHDATTQAIEWMTAEVTEQLLKRVVAA